MTVRPAPALRGLLLLSALAKQVRHTRSVSQVPASSFPISPLTPPGRAGHAICPSTTHADEAAGCGE